MPRDRSSSKNNSTANLGFEAKLWLAADKLRSNMDAAEYKQRRPRTHLPQIHLGRIRGTPRDAPWQR